MKNGEENIGKLEQKITKFEIRKANLNGSDI
jgi:hypothetical protein